MPKFDYLNIGSGFSSDAENYTVKENSFKLVAPKVYKYLSELFNSEEIEFYGEPGRQIC